ncbi:MAG: phosphoribosylamine--glycine ligase [Bacteroidales bacterium]|nr:phosphoribosylamine--glycine ligase [Bacteroidales bacterium]
MAKENILLIGSGGRESALAWKMRQSDLVDQLYIMPGNGSTANYGENVDGNPNDHEAVRRFIGLKDISMVVVGPEEPLVKGLADSLTEMGISVIGPRRKGAQLEGSKDFAKAFMMRHNIPTAAYKSFTKDTLKEGLDFLASLKAPYVLKADGLAAGKGVLIIDNLKEAQEQLKKMLDGMFGDASARVVIEEYLTGIEMSAFVLTDGKDYKILPEAKDYKRIGEGDTGLNTGGMGAVSPVPFADKEFLRKVEEKVIKPTIQGLQDDEIDYRGFIFFGLMNDGGEPKVIEYNVRLGDPETEVILPRIETDLVELFQATVAGRLSECNIKLSDKTCCTVMMVSGGYPGHYEKGKVITGRENVKGSIVFDAGTKREADGKVVTSGGRVLAVSTLAESKDAALAKSYEAIKGINFEGAYYRRDIGKDLDKYYKK